MKVFLAGVSAAVPRRAWGRYAEFIRTQGQQFRELLSYVECILPTVWRRVVEESVGSRCELFLDSGAFSAWSRGISIDLDEYARFIEERPGVFSVVANLDVIWGSEGGGIPSLAEIDQAAAQGWEQWQVLRRRLAPLGLDPLHVFHQGEDFRWLKRLMSEAEYFGVSRRQDFSDKENLKWLDQVFTLLTDDRGYPLRRVHGFGISSLEFLERFPWASIDSTSWVLTGRYGAVFIPLNGRVHKVTVSDQSPRQRGEGQHFRTFSRPEQRAIQQYLEEKGFTVEGLAGDYIQRDLANIQFFLDLERRWEPRRFERAGVQPRFF